MYLQYYGLDQDPFRLTPDPQFFFLGENQNRSIANLLYGIENKKGFIALTGEVGAGKTTLCRLLLKKLDQNVSVAIILNSLVDEITFLKQINRDFDIPYETDSHDDLVGHLYDFLISEKKSDRNVVVIIDECQNLKFEVLEQIRMLSNLETEKDKLLQIILIGQPEFLDMLNSHQLRQLNQRITVRAHVSSLSIKEMEQYIYHRLNIAGNKNAVVFTKSAIRKIYAFSKGIPRKINVICDYSLLAGYVDNSRKITKSLVSKALKDIEIKRDKKSEDYPKKNRTFIKTVLLFVLCFSVYSYFYPKNFKILRDQILHLFSLPKSSVQSEVKKDISLSTTSIKTSKDKINEKKQLIKQHSVLNKQEIKLKPQKNVKKIVETKIPKEVIKTNISETEKIKDLKDDVSENNNEITKLPTSKGSETAGNDKKEDKDSSLLKNDNKTARQQTSKIAIKYFSSLNKKDKAIWLLLSSWGIELSHPRIDENGKMIPLENQLNRFNFTVFSTWADMDLLRKINLPCALEIEENKMTRFVVFNALKNNMLRLYYAPGKMKVMPLNQFLKIWKGNSIVLTERGKFTLESETALFRGNEGEKIERLSEILSALKYDINIYNSVFDLDLEDIIKKFQLKNGLIPDGIVGVEAKLLFYSLLSKNIPRLIRLRKR